MATEVDIDRFVKDKADVRRVIAASTNGLLAQWDKLPEDRQRQLMDAMVSALADLTAVLMLGSKEITKEQFKEFMGDSFDYAEQMQKALEDGAFV